MRFDYLGIDNHDQNKPTGKAVKPNKLQVSALWCSASISKTPIYTELFAFLPAGYLLVNRGYP